MADRRVRRPVPLSILAGVCLATVWLSGRPGQAAPTMANEAEIKAQFFERFTRFIEWPEAALGKDRPFVVCLAGGNPLAAEIERRMTRTTVKGAATRIRRLSAKPPHDTGGCHALYLASVTRTDLPALLARTRGRPILTVSDSEGFSRHGVLINMYIEGRFIRFEVNDPALRASGLRASSKLLRLARLIDAQAQ